MSKFDTVKKNLEGRGYTVKEFATAKEAGAYLDTQIDGATVGIGGSSTVLESGAYDLLVKHNTVTWHWKDKDMNAARKASMQADYYLTSVNALTEAGEMVNLDGTGNRVAGMLYGHKKVFYLIGTNKLVEGGLEDAIKHVREYCGPRRAAQLNMQTPCVAAGDFKCRDCRSPQRICNGMNILFTPMGGMPAEILLINEDLGI